MSVSFPQPPLPDPYAAGPAGLEDAVKKLFAPVTQPRVPQIEDPYANLDRRMLLKRFEDAKKDAQDLRAPFERAWWQKLNYIAGKQWQYWDSRRGQWRDKRLKKWIPKPVTNKIKEVLQSILSMFASVKTGVIVRPIGGKPLNIITANTADQMQPLIHDQHEMDDVMEKADFWFTALGNAFLYVWYDTDEKYGMQPILHDECVACATVVDPESIKGSTFICPACGGTESNEVEVGTEPAGKGMTDVLSPFEVLLPSAPTDFKDVTRIIRSRWRDKAYYTDNYPELAATMTWEKAPTERSLHLFKSIASMADGVGAATLTSAGGGSTSQSEGQTEYEYWEQPSKQFPGGLFFRVAGESSPEIIEDPEQGTPGPIPCTTREGVPMWPWIHLGYAPFGGRMWATGALDPLIQKQDMLNQLDSLILLIVMRMANPIWLEPKGAGVERFTGEPGLVVKYNLVGASGQGKPERLDGTGPHASLFTLREQYLRDIEEMAGTFDIIKGQKPTGVEAFSALQLLVERSQSRFTTAFGERGKAYRKWFSIALEFERSYGPNERVMNVMGPNRTWTYRHFMNADLQGQVTVAIEDGSNVPKTSLGKRAAIEQANNLQLINPQDPDQQYGILSQFGLSDLMPGLDSSIQAALREQDMFEKWVDAGMPPMPTYGPTGPLMVRPWDAGLDGQGLTVRINELRKWANSDTMQEKLQKFPQVGAMLTLYYQQLVGLYASGPMAMMGGGPGQPGQPGADGQPGQPGAPATPGLGGAMTNSNRESGSTGNVPNDKGTDSAAPPM